MGFLVIDAWKLFVHTGNIETYLLLKEIENDPYNHVGEQENKDVYSFGSKM